MNIPLDALENVVTAEPGVEEQPGPMQPEADAIETQLTEEISELWSSHVRLVGTRKATVKELRQIRERLAERLHAMKALVCRPELGRASQWQSWLRGHGIPRSTADRLVARYEETLSHQSESMLNGTPSGPEPPSVEELARDIWRRVGKILTTDEQVVRFIGCIAEISGVAYKMRSEGSVIFSPKPQAIVPVMGTGVSAETTCPAPQISEIGGNPEVTPVAEPVAQISGDVPAAACELPDSAPATDGAPQPSDANGQTPVDAPAADPFQQPPAAISETASPVTVEEIATPIEVTASQEPLADVPPAAAVDEGCGAEA